jgi:hypothetical protein
MGATQAFGIVLLFAVPLLFWLLLTGIAQRGRRRVFSAVVTGHDGRLSLSRLQAFLWTMLIAGAYCSAMAVHPRISISSEKDKAKLEASYNAANAKLAAAETAFMAKEAEAFSKKVDAEANAERVETARKRLRVAQDTPAKLPDPRLTPTQQAAVKAQQQATLKTAEDVLTAALLAKDAADDAYEQVARAMSLAKRDRTSSQQTNDAAKMSFRQTQWVRIPSELLALAGISLATGVFASVISAVGSNSNAPAQAPPDITGIAFNGPNDELTVTGTNFGTEGELRLNGRGMPDPKWTTTQIIVAVNPAANYSKLTVDTPNGKETHAIASRALGPPISVLEWRDLLREDTNPAKFSMTKFQMLGWTIIAIFFFAVILVRNLNPAIDSLPTIDSTIVLLTGLSQGGYLGGKIAANM